ncbi:hypothetical protein VCSRO74_2070 [Vibrio cholerae]|nr:hypothetical protein VCSRO74_2070 [Vibrio cholerae]
MLIEFATRTKNGEIVGNGDAVLNLSIVIAFRIQPA